MSPTPISDAARGIRTLPARLAKAARRQEGFTLAGVIVILTVMSIMIAYTVPQQWSIVMRRERDRQTIFVMKQFARGIMNWENKHRSLPVSLEQLQKATAPRMVRNEGKWPCPITGSEKDWILVPPGAVQGAGVGGAPLPGAGGGLTSVQTPNAEELAKQRQQQGGAGGAGGGVSKLNPEASPKDYVGPFVGVRPNASGKAYMSLNGTDDYALWVYTSIDLRNEITARQNAMTPQP